MFRNGLPNDCSDDHGKVERVHQPEYAVHAFNPETGQLEESYEKHTDQGTHVWRQNPETGETEEYFYENNGEGAYVYFLHTCVHNNDVRRSVAALFGELRAEEKQRLQVKPITCEAHQERFAQAQKEVEEVVEGQEPYQEEAQPRAEVLQNVPHVLSVRS